METGNLMIDAQTAFARERRRRMRDSVLRRLLRRPSCANQLQSLEARLGRTPPAAGRRVGLRAVALDTIVGTAEEAKIRSFDRRFRPAARSRREATAAA